MPLSPPHRASGTERSQPRGGRAGPTAGACRGRLRCHSPELSWRQGSQTHPETKHVPGRLQRHRTTVCSWLIVLVDSGTKGLGTLSFHVECSPPPTRDPEGRQGSHGPWTRDLTVASEGTLEPLFLQRRNLGPETLLGSESCYGKLACRPRPGPVPLPGPRGPLSCGSPGTAVRTRLKPPGSPSSLSTLGRLERVKCHSSELPVHRRTLGNVFCSH